MTEKIAETLRTLVDRCRDQVEGDLCELVAELGPALIEGARVLVASSRDDARRHACINLQFELRNHWAKAAPALKEALARRRKPAPRAGQNYGDVENLQIVTDDETSMQLAMRGVVDRVNSACSEESSSLERRVSYLVLRGAMAQGDGSFRVSSLCDCLQSACAEVVADVGQRIVLMQLMGEHMASELPQLFRAINEILYEADILPRLKRSYQGTTPVDPNTIAAESTKMAGKLEMLVKARTQARGATKTTDAAAASQAFFLSLKSLQKDAVKASNNALTNVVKLARDSEGARHVGVQESVTLDIVAELFDLIFGDKSVAEGIKTLVARLQTPVLKVAMLNQRFFADRSHPARLFLDSISGIAIRWGKVVDANDPFYRKLSELVDRIQHTYDGDVAVFEAANAELSNFLAEREEIEAEESRVLAEAVRAREEDLRLQRAAQLRAQRTADQLLAPLITHGIPTGIAHFLLTYWRDVLQGRVYASGAESAAVTSTLQVVTDLLWTVTPKHKPEDRQRQAAALPALLKRLNAGFEEIGTSANERSAFMDMLVELQLAALRADLRGAGKAAEPKEAPDAPVISSGPTLQVSHSTASGVRVQDISLPGGEGTSAESTPDSANLRRVRQLVRGDWVDFMTAGQSRRERLTWINPSRTLLLFSNSASACAISITPEALAVRLRNLTASLVKPDSPIFERALHGAVQSLERLT
ncbi:DUF1631 family protein [Sulfuritalea sp.]|uniref:DUF1631 family protein n=1 Tax=Sulfuritalea sp. TaxID=2480090 RepID=UPI001ACA8851|nr:DUF1631 family protein [Sulfuritalea sp.]MBN8474556.1 DUF1631 family protein [Sulfuritalea sp.]